MRTIMVRSIDFISDIDECVTNIHNCSKNTRCTNTEGSYNCSCNPGFSGDMDNCTARTPTVQTPRDPTTALVILDTEGMDINAKTSTSVPKKSTIVARATPLVQTARDYSTVLVILVSGATDTTAQTSTSVPKISTIVARITPLVPIARDRSAVIVILDSEGMDITAQTSTSVLQKPTTSTRRPSVQTPRDLTTALVTLDSAGMYMNAKTLTNALKKTHNCSHGNSTCENTKGSFKCICKPGLRGDGYNCRVDLLVALPKDCADLYRTGQRRDGVFTFDPDGAGAFEVFCDQTNNGGGWIVFQRKRRGSYSFSKDWNDYKNGFGNQSKDFWPGLDKLHRLTISSHHQLRICGRHCDTQYKLYKSFKVQSEETNYKLEVGELEDEQGNGESSMSVMGFD
ncbi:Fibrinogen C domain-containing protein 1-A [Stylophora pistillata]|uniref:Fibrinogen C domain-containing protein 1-A n=1 Tax=Stylophora pistillata TaxID=50429 RepID=A0A2B4RF27_STYPI|nr:Fibrinogen C domain-containing protein 1-A [Stylophora pistillata]